MDVRDEGKREGMKHGNERSSQAFVGDQGFLVSQWLVVYLFPHTIFLKGAQILLKDRIATTY